MMRGLKGGIQRLSMFYKGFYAQMYVYQGKLVFRFRFVGHEFRQGRVFRSFVMEKWRIKMYFLSNILNFTVVWHKIKYYNDFQL